MMPVEAFAGNQQKKKKRRKNDWEKDTELIDWGAEVKRDSSGTVVYKDTAKILEYMKEEVYVPVEEKLDTVKEEVVEIVEEQAPTNEPFVTSLLQEAFKHMGKRYSYGSGGPATFDCSGLTSYCFRKVDVSLPHSSREQYNYGTHVDKIADLEVGDLVFFKGRSTSSYINHVGIVTEVKENSKDFKFIHAASTGVIESNYTEEYYRIRYVGATRVRPKE